METKNIYGKTLYKWVENISFQCSAGYTAYFAVCNPRTERKYFNLFAECIKKKRLKNCNTSWQDWRYRIESIDYEKMLKVLKIKTKELKTFSHKGMNRFIKRLRRYFYNNFFKQKKQKYTRKQVKQNKCIYILSGKSFQEENNFKLKELEQRKNKSNYDYLKYVKFRKELFIDKLKNLHYDKTPSQIELLETLQQEHKQVKKEMMIADKYIMSLADEVINNENYKMLDIYFVREHLRSMSIPFLSKIYNILVLDESPDGWEKELEKFSKVCKWMQYKQLQLINEDEARIEKAVRDKPARPDNYLKNNIMSKLTFDSGIGNAKDKTIFEMLGKEK